MNESEHLVFGACRFGLCCFIFGVGAAFDRLNYILSNSVHPLHSSIVEAKCEQALPAPTSVLFAIRLRGFWVSPKRIGSL